MIDSTSPQKEKACITRGTRIVSYLADVLARGGEGDLVDLVGVEPDLPLSALQHGGGEPLLELERHLQGTKNSSYY